MTQSLEFAMRAVSVSAFVWGNFKQSYGDTPYRFEVSRFSKSCDLQYLGQALANLLKQSPVMPEVLFGSPYGGVVPCLATITHLGNNMEWAYGGREVVGASVKGRRVAIIDDCMIKGWASAQALGIISQNGGEVSECVFVFDRQEQGSLQGFPAAKEFEVNYQVPVRSLFGFSDLLEAIRLSDDEVAKLKLPELLDYQARCCVIP